MADPVVALGAVAHAVPRIDGSPAEGVHVVWIGPRPWRYSLKGFRILRRRSRETAPDLCELVTGDRLVRLRREHLLPLDFGTARYGTVPCPAPLAPLPSDVDPDHDDEVGDAFRLPVDDQMVVARMANAALFEVPSRRPGSVVARRALLAEVWGAADADPHALEVVAGRLRRRLTPTGLSVEAVVRRGYRLTRCGPPVVDQDHR